MVARSLPDMVTRWSGDSVWGCGMDEMRTRGLVVSGMDDYYRVGERSVGMDAERKHSGALRGDRSSQGRSVLFW